MKKHIGKAALAAALLAGAGFAQADQMFIANLTHEQEVINPPIPNEGSNAFAVFVLNSDRTRLTYDIMVNGLDFGRISAAGVPGAAPGNTPDPNDDALRLHIHRAPAGANGGIVFGMIDAAVGVRNDIAPNNLLIQILGPTTTRITGAWDLTEGNGNNGTITLATELNNLLAGGLYVNIHTSDHAGGEIRGQIQAPEPGSLALLALGLVGLLGARRRIAK